jgi:hypothetical protein
MPGDPRRCRLNAARCLTLARRAKRPEAHEAFAATAKDAVSLFGICRHSRVEALLRIPLTALGPDEIAGATRLHLYKMQFRNE